MTKKMLSFLILVFIGGIIMADNERNYRMELQNIINGYPQMRGFDWVFGDDHRETGGDLHLYHSYITGFGNDKMIIIPVKILEQKITSEEPIIVTRDNIKDISRLGPIIHLTIDGMSEAISWHSYAVHKINYATRMHLGNFQDVTAEYFSYDGPYRLLHRYIKGSNSRVTTQYNDGTDSLLNLEQKESYKKYNVFIKNLIGALQPSQRDNDNLIGGIKKLLIIGSIVIGISILSILARVILLKLKGM
jgi:hypothetical protein